MERINVTVTTDASFYLKDKVGGFAFQIKSNDCLIKMWGPLKDRVQNPTEAEMKAILNALYRLQQKGYKINILTINTDCEFIVKHMFTENENRKQIIQILTEKIRLALKALDYEQLNIKHVKAHSVINSARRFVNDWCDKHSRKGSMIASDILHERPIEELPDYLRN